MEAKYLFVILTIGLTFGFFYSESYSSSIDVMSHWSERRCDFDVLLTSFLYKPSEDTRSSSEFASDNFKFCISSKSTNYLNTIFGVLYELLRKQFAASDIMINVLKVLRSQLNTIYEPFRKLMNRFWVKFVQIGTLASRIFQHTFMAMKKAGATAVASLFIALSLQTTLLNTIDLVINVIMIVLYIFLGLIVVFFLPILPLLIIILITVAGIENAMPGKTGAMGSLFCFAKGTQVILKNGKTHSIETLRPGDILLDNIIVQAVIEVPGEELYDLDGILVSGYHLVYDTYGNRIYVKDHPRSFITNIKDATLWTLVTNKREIPVHGTRGTLRFADWDEIPDTKKANRAWDLISGEILNGPGFKSNYIPQNAPCLDSKIKVFMYQTGWRELSEIKIGDWILDKVTWTQVIGKADRRVGGGFGSSGNRISDGTWILGFNNLWDHWNMIPDTVPWNGIQLITKSGSFKIKQSNGHEYIVRDFTEVGSNYIFESDVRIESELKH